jgi:phage terminase small subunit
VNTDNEKDLKEKDEQTTPLQQEFERNFVDAIEIKLPAKYEVFAQAYVKCSNLTDAYMKAFPKNNSKRKTITEAASRLIKEHPEIKARIMQLLRGAAKKTIASLEDSLEVVTEIMKDSTDEKVQLAAASKLIDYHTEATKELNVNLKGSITNTIAKDALSGIAELIAQANKG